MATSSPQVQTLPRFLLPSLTWKPNVSRTATGALCVSPGHEQRQPNKINRRGITTQVSALPSHHGASTSTYRSFRRGAVLSARAAQTPLPECLAPKKQSILQSSQLKRAFHVTARRPRDHHFDTLKFVQRLKDEGFSEEQSVAMMKVLSDVIEER